MTDEDDREVDLSEIAEGDRERAKALSRKARRIQMIRNVNAALANEIESFGGSVDVAVPRLEAFIQYLQEAGILSPEQVLDEQEGWERALKPQLVSVRDSIKKRHQQAKAERDRTQKVGPGGSEPKGPSQGALILPMGTKREKRGKEGSQSED